MKIAVIGGDIRMCRAAEELQRMGYEIAAYGVPCAGSVLAPELADALCGAGAVLLPMPASRTKGTIDAPLWDGTIETARLAQLVGRDAVVLAGMPDAELTRLFAQRGTQIVDYSGLDEVAAPGAVSTVEGAAALLIEAMDRTIYGSRILIIGAGRIAWRAARVFDALGASVTVCARSAGDLTRLRSAGYDALGIEQLAQAAAGCDAIVNTAPAVLITRDVSVGDDCFVLDLASAPGCADRESIALLGARYRRVPGIPGRYAPRSAGIALARAVGKLLNGYDRETYDK